MANSNLNQYYDDQMRRLQEEIYRQQQYAQYGNSLNNAGLLGQGIGQPQQANPNPASVKQDPKHLNPKLLLTRKA